MRIRFTTILARAMWLTVPFLAACDPLVNIEGAFFPAWLVSGLFGIVATSMTYVLFVRVDLHKYLLAPVLTYMTLMITYTGLLWLTLYGW
ncbi:MAG: YtcA family lipoprotein [Phycisphaerales bacterium]|nr:YtcA family lipoprotein [Phycisphaerales bacterium]